MSKEQLKQQLIELWDCEEYIAGAIVDVCTVSEVLELMEAAGDYEE